MSNCNTGDFWNDDNGGDVDGDCDGEDNYDNGNDNDADEDANNDNDNDDDDNDEDEDDNNPKKNIWVDTQMSLWSVGPLLIKSQPMNCTALHCIALQQNPLKYLKMHWQ